MDSATAGCAGDSLSADACAELAAAEVAEVGVKVRPHWVQKRASGLQAAPHWLQDFSKVKAAGSVSCLVPQCLQNLVLGGSGWLHWEQFMVCNG